MIIEMNDWKKKEERIDSRENRVEIENVTVKKKINTHKTILPFLMHKKYLSNHLLPLQNCIIDFFIHTHTSLSGYLGS